MRLIDEIYLEYPFKGSRRLRDAILDRHGICVNRKRVVKLMRLLGLAALHPGPRTTHRGKGHKVYPYLLGGMDIERVNQVWATDVTLYSYVQGVCVLSGCHGLALKEGAELEGVEYDGREFLRGSVGGGNSKVREARDIQHRSGQSVHKPGVYGGIEEGRH